MCSERMQSVLLVVSTPDNGHRYARCKMPHWAHMSQFDGLYSSSNVHGDVCNSDKCSPGFAFLGKRARPPTHDAIPDISNMAELPSSME